MCGCLPKQNQLNIRTYLFDLPSLSKHPGVKTANTATNQQSLPIVELTDFSAIAPFDEKFFIFKLNANNYQQDYYNRFLALPVTQLKTIMIRALRSSGYFRRVIRGDSEVKANYEMKFALNQLYVDATDKQHIYAVVSLTAKIFKEDYNGVEYSGV